MLLLLLLLLLLLMMMENEKRAKKITSCMLSVEKDENLGIHTRPASSAKASAALMPLFFFFFFLTRFSRFIIVKNAQNGMERTGE